MYQNVTTNVIKKVLFKEEYITVGPYTIDIAKIAKWVKYPNSLIIYFIGTPYNMNIHSVPNNEDEYEDEGPWQNLNAPYEIYDRLKKENFDALVNYLENRFKPRKIA